MEATVEEARAYFEEHGLRPLLSGGARERGGDQRAGGGYLEASCGVGRPADPLGFLQQQLGAEAARRRGEPPEASPEPAPSDLEEDTGWSVDPLLLLVQEALPAASGARGAAVPLQVAGASTLAGRSCWAGGFNKSLLDGWLVQPSPCCAAASVAGSFNALWGLCRRDAGHFTVRECADLMADHCDVLRAKKQSRLERLLGVHEGALDEFLAALDARLAAEGLEWAARAGPKAVTKPAAMRASRAVLRAASAAAGGARSTERPTGEAPGADGAPTAEVAAAERPAHGAAADQPVEGAEQAAAERPADGAPSAEAVAAERPAQRAADHPAEGAEGAVAERLTDGAAAKECAIAAEAAALRRSVFAALGEVLGEDSGREADGLADEGDAEEEEEVEGAGGGTQLPQESALVQLAGGPDWKKELQELLTKRKAVFKLRAQKPNTSEVGTWGIKQAAQDLAEARGLGTVRVRCLMGRKGSMRGLVAPLSKGDTQSSIDQQWDALKAAFSSPSSVLLFHLTNHYALIFAWREWTEQPEGDRPAAQRRQVLTARKGQRPSAWIEFEEVRRTMLGWSGYHILQLQRVADDAAVGGAPPREPGTGGPCADV
ncbi:unnamed protein product [Prorocentrum cordatum]|uniref:Ubiquitinyl hydrolase 1 n=1 Tax=Prorocentrum cordatum TaxID=2364126 RepID=A0ABN9Q5Y0_9DINO|nr:unnamed protein product [Polarella glacialis]